MDLAEMKCLYPNRQLMALSSNSNSNDSTVEEYLRELSIKNKEKHQITSAVRLPQVIIDSDAAFIVPFQVSLPNFITDKTVRAEIIQLDARNFDADITDKIVLIENADPGFDWIFSKRIAGLITKFGGANPIWPLDQQNFYYQPPWVVENKYLKNLRILHIVARLWIIKKLHGSSLNGYMIIGLSSTEKRH